MHTDLFSQLNKAIEKYEGRTCSENDFHSAIESIVRMITEFDLNDFRTFLLAKEGDLEQIDFMVNEKDRRSEYLKIVNQIKDQMAHWERR